MFPPVLNLVLRKNGASLRDESKVVRLSQKEGSLIKVLVIQPLAKHTVLGNMLDISDAYVRNLALKVGKKTEEKFGFPLIERLHGGGYRLARQVVIKKRDP